MVTLTDGAISAMADWLKTQTDTVLRFCEENKEDFERWKEENANVGMDL